MNPVTHCQRCHKALRPAARFCARCGLLSDDFGRGSLSALAAAVSAQPRPAHRPAAGRANRAPVFVLIGVACGGCAVAVLVALVHVSGRVTDGPAVETYRPGREWVPPPTPVPSPPHVVYMPMPYAAPGVPGVPQVSGPYQPGGVGPVPGRPPGFGQPPPPHVPGMPNRFGVPGTAGGYVDKYGRPVQNR